MFSLCVFLFASGCSSGAGVRNGVKKQEAFFEKTRNFPKRETISAGEVPEFAVVEFFHARAIKEEGRFALITHTLMSTEVTYTKPPLRTEDLRKTLIIAARNLLLNAPASLGAECVILDKIKVMRYGPIKKKRFWIQVFVLKKDLLPREEMEQSFLFPGAERSSVSNEEMNFLMRDVLCTKGRNKVVTFEEERADFVSVNKKE